MKKDSVTSSVLVRCPHCGKEFYLTCDCPVLCPYCNLATLDPEIHAAEKREIVTVED